MNNETHKLLSSIKNERPEMSKILLVEDHIDAQDIISELLFAVGYDVIVTDSAEKALTLIAIEQIDILITDINLPGLSGIQLAHEINSYYPDIKVIVCSGSDFDKEHSIYPSALWIKKPFKIEEFLETVHQVRQQADLSNISHKLQRRYSNGRSE